jgi:hypothetical protein
MSQSIFGPCDYAGVNFGDVASACFDATGLESLFSEPDGASPLITTPVGGERIDGVYRHAEGVGDRTPAVFYFTGDRLVNPEGHLGYQPGNHRVAAPAQEFGQQIEEDYNAAKMHAALKEEVPCTLVTPATPIHMFKIEARPVIDVDRQPYGGVVDASSELYRTAKRKFDAATFGQAVPDTLQHKPSCLNCVFFGALCGNPEVLDLLQVRSIGGPSHETLRGLELDDPAMDKLNSLFKQEVRKPTTAAAHTIQQGDRCAMFPQTKELFLIPDTKLGKNLRSWKHTASAKKRATVAR